MHVDDVAEEAETEAVEAETEDGEGEVQATEAEARKQGWVPRNEFRGNPKNWTPAEDYLKRGDPRYLRSALDQTQAELRDLKKAREQDAQAFAERLDRFEAMSKAQRAKLYGDIETARRAAVAEGNTEEYDRLNQVEADLYSQEQAAGKPTAKKETAPERPADADIIEAWIDDNPWWDTHPDMQHAAMTINQRIANRHPNMSAQDQLDKTREEVVKRFPDYFGKSGGKPQPKKPGAAAVEGGQRMASSPKGKGFSDIPAEERKIIERHIEEGLYKDKADAAAAYWR